MVDAETYVFNLDSAFVITWVFVEFAGDARLSPDALVAVEEHRYRLFVIIMVPTQAGESHYNVIFYHWRECRGCCCCCEGRGRRSAA